MTKPLSFQSSVEADNLAYQNNFDGAETGNETGNETGEARPTRRSSQRDEQGLISTAPIGERAILVGVEIDGKPGILSLEDSLTELALLAKTANVETIGTLTQKLDAPNPSTLIGTGKVQELQEMVLATGANLVIFDDELSPRQQREIEGVVSEQVKVLDRTVLILDIFARHARTREGAVQVELAQYEYRLPRLTRAWTHLERQGGGRAGGASGGVGLRGPGETQLEVDRREISRRITALKKQLEEIEKQRRQHRDQRRQTATPIIALVGYTNAGKSTLLNALSHANVLAEDKLFATLDPTTRRILLPTKQPVLITDTVGFIQKLPTMLVASFRATLEEVTDADILIHVVDLSHPNMDEQVAAVEEVLEELGAGDKTVITVLNKLDRIASEDAAQQARLNEAKKTYPNAVAVSAMKGQGLDELSTMIDQVLRQRMAPINVLIPYARGDLVALMHEHGFIESEEHTETGTRLVGRAPVIVAGRLSGFQVK